MTATRFNANSKGVKTLKRRPCASSGKVEASTKLMRVLPLGTMNEQCDSLGITVELSCRLTVLVQQKMYKSRWKRRNPKN